jgi:hypothetical protein
LVSFAAPAAYLAWEAAKTGVFTHALAAFGMRGAVDPSSLDFIQKVKEDHLI